MTPAQRFFYTCTRCGSRGALHVWVHRKWGCRPICAACYEELVCAY